MPPPEIATTSKKEITLRALIIFCMEGIWREAFFKALTPIIVITFASLAALLPLYMVGNVMLIRSDQQAIK